MTDGTHYRKIPEDRLLDDYYANLHGAYGSMREAFDMRADATGLTQDDLATMLDVNKALISKRLNGEANQTLRTLSYMGTCMNCRVKVTFVPYEEIGTRNFYAPTPSAANAANTAIILDGGPQQPTGLSF